MHYANLHLHSIFSDGRFDPYELVVIGKSLGYGAMALTDHETDGGCREFMQIARQEGLEALPGIEFYARDNGVHFHIVCLDHDMDDPRLREFVRRRCDIYGEYSRQIVERALKKGYLRDITWNDILDDCEDGMWICVDQIMASLRRRRLLSRSAQDEVALRDKMFREPDAAALYPDYPEAEEVIGIIRGAGGVAVLAHPFEQTRYVGRLVDLGLNGIEISHPDLHEYTKFAVEAAETYHLYRSGGTDHTGVLSGCNGTLAIPALQGISMDDYLTLKERRLG